MYQQPQQAQQPQQYAQPTAYDPQQAAAASGFQGVAASAPQLQVRARCRHCARFSIVLEGLHALFRNAAVPSSRDSSRELLLPPVMIIPTRLPAPANRTRRLVRAEIDGRRIA